MTSGHAPSEHDRYEELCALATAELLTTEESAALWAHLEECADCREVFTQYKGLATEGMPLLADLRAPLPESPEFDEEPALARLLERTRNLRPQESAPPDRAARVLWFARPAWRGLVAASILAAVALSAYRLGEHRHGRVTVVSSASPSQRTDPRAEQQAMETALQGEHRREADLQALLATRSADIEKLRGDAKDTQDRLDSLTASLENSKADAAAQVAALTAQRAAAVERLQTAEQSYQTVQDQLNALQSERKQDLLRVASLENQVSGLTAVLDQQDKRTKNDEQYLASDKDIRDLIGARNLYIADIMDVREDGTSRKPFGRVFYTKTKSLIFYAYDLDRQPGVKQASTFQVWGKTGANGDKPVSLGVLYMDSETNRRWALKVNDPLQLAQLDSIFVTVEPHGQSQKPTGKPFLYASLRRDANHP